MDQQNKIQEDIIKELGLENLPENDQKELIGKMTEAILKRIFLETINKLDDADKEIYGKMIEEKKSPEEVDKFLTEKIPDYDQLLKKVVEDFKEEIKNV